MTFMRYISDTYYIIHHIISYDRLLYIMIEYVLPLFLSAESRHLWRSQLLGPLEEEGTTLNTRRRKVQIHVLEAFPLKRVEATWATEIYLSKKYTFKKSLLNSQVFSCTLCELSHVNTSLIHFCFFILILFVIVTTVAAPRRGRRLARDNSTRVAPEDRSRPHKHRRPHGQVALILVKGEKTNSCNVSFFVFESLWISVPIPWGHWVFRHSLKSRCMGKAAVWFVFSHSMSNPGLSKVDTQG